jgi:hypothetical protein
VVKKKQRQNVNSLLKLPILFTFGIKLGDQAKPSAPRTLSSVCVEVLRNWTKGKEEDRAVGHTNGLASASTPY